MTKNTNKPLMVAAAEQATIYAAAKAYAAQGLSVIPLNGKRPALKSWTGHQKRCATREMIDDWHRRDILKNVGIVCGAVSGNLVVLDLDGAAGYPAFAAALPHLAQTYTVASGGGVGKHVYFRVKRLPKSVKAMNTPIGHLEVCGEGRQVVAPPSIHPKTGNPYRVEKEANILQVDNLDDLVVWVEAFKPTWQGSSLHEPPKIPNPNGDVTINPKLIAGIADVLLGKGYRARGEWLEGACLTPYKHRNGDRNPSFAYNTVSGYGYCHVCGVMLTKDICHHLNLDPQQYGGLVERPDVPNISQPVDLSRAPQESPPVPPMVEPPKADGHRLPSWLAAYMAWAGRTGNQTPMLFHQAAGLWLLATAVGRRLYGEAPWGIRLYPNLYLMLVAGTTFYRKSTAYKLAEQVARTAIPHMLMPTPGSPERFQEALAGRMPNNFEKLTQEQQDRLTRAQPFAAQRGLLKDEVAGLFGAINKRDYMTGMKDLLMELYDCPDYFDKDTQSGLNIVENAALSILGVTTPAGLGSAVSEADWSNGLLIRFALLCPEKNYQERPAAQAYQPVPQTLIDTLRVLHERLPAPEQTAMGVKPPAALRLEVKCWSACQAYGDRLRQLCDPKRETELDDRLKGVYGRLHVQAFKLATLFAALDWLDTSEPTPTVTEEHWQAGQGIAETWRQSAHQLLTQLDQSGEAVQEKRHQDQMLGLIREQGQLGIALRALYRRMHVTAKVGRQVAQELVKAGLVYEVRINGAEGYTASE